MGFLDGKRALIVGIASPRSIAWGIAQAMSEQGAELALSYQNEKLQSRVQKAADQFNGTLVAPCDVAHDKDIDDLFQRIDDHWGSIDIVIHAVGFAPREQLAGSYLESVTREGFAIAHDISSYSFAALAKAGEPLLNPKGALLTLSYLGALRAMPFYNVMGLAKASLEANVRYLAQSLGPKDIRVNGISAGPIKTLAAAGISNFRKMLDFAQKTAPLQRSVTPEEVGNVAAFLCSDLASGVTGEITYVDAGYSTAAMGGLDD